MALFFDFCIIWGKKWYKLRFSHSEYMNFIFFTSNVMLIEGMQSV